ncbi:hypothetical protein CR513_15400, partial [Mucuna pruriens]
MDMAQNAWACQFETYFKITQKALKVIIDGKLKMLSSNYHVKRTLFPSTPLHQEHPNKIG